MRAGRCLCFAFGAVCAAAAPLVRSSPPAKMGRGNLHSHYPINNCLQDTHTHYVGIIGLKPLGLRAEDFGTDSASFDHWCSPYCGNGFPVAPCLIATAATAEQLTRARQAIRKGNAITIIAFEFKFELNTVTTPTANPNSTLNALLPSIVPIYPFKTNLRL